MLIITLLNILISNAVAVNKNKSVLYSRIVMLSLLCVAFVVKNTLCIKPLNLGLGIYNGFFNISILSQYFNIFVLTLASVICILTGFYPRKFYKTSLDKKDNLNSSENKAFLNIENNTNVEKVLNLENDEEILLNKNGFQFTILEYSLIILFILSGAILLISTGDLVSLFLSIELQSYGLYIICTIYRDSESATNSGLTYFLLGGLSSCFILLGSAILYVNSGNTNLDNIYILNSLSELTFKEQFENSNETLNLLSDKFNPYKINYISFSFIILTVGLLFKISAAPFHFWSPDVYDGIPTVVTTFVAIIAKISLLILMLELVSYTDINISNAYETIELTSDKIYDANSGAPGDWKNIIVLSSLMSLIIGSILGLTQYRIKRLFAYSTISHVGFILLALCVNKIESIQGYIFYILQYSVSNLNAFFVLITIGYTLHEYIIKTPSKKINKESKELKSKDKYIDIENSPIQLLSQIKGYFYINSFLSISFAITLFSFVGIPPLIGFFAKQMVLSAALDQGYIFITLVAIITSVIGAGYYLNIIKLIFFTESDYIKKSVSNGLYNLRANSSNTVYINDKLSVVISVLTMLILLFIFMPDEWFRVVSILSLSIN